MLTTDLGIKRLSGSGSVVGKEIENVGLVLFTTQVTLFFLTIPKADVR
jgi:hypothetical protein